MVSMNWSGGVSWGASLLFWWMVLIGCVSLVCSSRGSSGSGPGSLFISFEDHDRTVAKLSGLIKQSKPETALTIRRKPEQSHCARPHDYKKASLQLDFSGFTQVLGVQEVTSMEELPQHLRKTSLSADCGLIAIVDVQAMCSFESLVDLLLPMGLIPAVVPEFKGITIGGALQGLAAESTSFKYGLVHDVVTGFEALLGDGTVLWCSPTSNPELFFSVPGSFGTIALCTRIRLLCIKAQPYVKVTCNAFNSQRDCLVHMAAIQDAAKDTFPDPQSLRCDMIEGIGFSKKSFASVEASFVPAPDSSFPQSRCNAWGYKWFYNQVKDCIRPRRIWSRLWPFSTSSSTSTIVASVVSPGFSLPTKDYLFRHDRGSFWMASYRIPQFVGKLFMGSLLDNSAMFRLANWFPWAFPKSQIVLQDFMLPRTTCESFFNTSNEIVSVWPIWLLPMRNFGSQNQQQQEKSSIFGIPQDETNDLCNIGVYGIPTNKYNHEQANRLLEAVLYQHGGRKVYYSHSFYEKDFFYSSLYDGKRYFGLRQKYKAEGRLPEIWDKIVVKDGKL